MYFSKALTTGTQDLNWRGFIVNSIDNTANANLFQAFQITSFNGVTMSMNAGRAIGANPALPTTRSHFMSIVNEDDTKLATFTISPQNPATRLTATQLIMVPDNLATHPLPTGLRAAFTQPVGNITANYTPTLDNEFVNKKYVDSKSGGGYTPLRIRYNPTYTTDAFGTGI